MLKVMLKSYKHIVNKPKVCNIAYNFKIYRFLEHKKISLISHDYIPQNEDLLAIKNLDDFIGRTNYKIENN